VHRSACVLVRYLPAFYRRFSLEIPEHVCCCHASPCSFSHFSFVFACLAYLPGACCGRILLQKAMPTCLLHYSLYLPVLPRRCRIELNCRQEQTTCLAVDACWVPRFPFLPPATFCGMNSDAPSGRWCDSDVRDDLAVPFSGSPGAFFCLLYVSPSLVRCVLRRDLLPASPLLLAVGAVRVVHGIWVPERRRACGYSASACDDEGRVVLPGIHCLPLGGTLYYCSIQTFMRFYLWYFAFYSPVPALSLGDCSVGTLAPHVLPHSRMGVTLARCIPGFSILPYAAFNGTMEF